MASTDMKDTDMDVLPLAARVPLVVLFLATGLEPSWIIGLPSTIARHISALSGYLIRICNAAGTLAVTAGLQIWVVGLLLATACVVAAIPLDLMNNLELAGGFLLLAAYGLSSLMVQRIRLQAAAIKIQSNHQNRSIKR